MSGMNMEVGKNDLVAWFSLPTFLLMFLSLYLYVVCVACNLIGDSYEGTHLLQFIPSNVSKLYICVYIRSL
uniref:Uncharacterized protein n=1 Tax=Nelumbo nucifera TaxID=4432 RepID=A0A822ZTN9_NELNU|nr:TPA_asm: hypothetical protein HUJ06_016662 [Nelumbo nucifera]